MKFGAVPIVDALGATAVHSIRQGDFVLKKGTRIGPSEIAALKAVGIKEVTVARLDVEMSRKIRLLPISRQRLKARVCALIWPSRAAATYLQKVLAFWSSTGMRSTRSIVSTRRLQWRHCRHTSRSSKVR